MYWTLISEITITVCRTYILFSPMCGEFHQSTIAPTNGKITFLWIVECLEFKQLKGCSTSAPDVAFRDIS